MRSIDFISVFKFKLNFIIIHIWNFNQIYENGNWWLVSIILIGTTIFIILFNFDSILMYSINSVETLFIFWQLATDDGWINVTSDFRSHQSGPPWLSTSSAPRSLQSLPDRTCQIGGGKGKASKSSRHITSKLWR